MCFAIISPVFLPAMRLVTAITKSVTAQITTSFDHNYKTGLIIRLQIPISYGMGQIDKMIGAIIVTSSTTFTVDINTVEYDTFVFPTPRNQCAQVVPIGQINSKLDSSVENVLV